MSVKQMSLIGFPLETEEAICKWGDMQEISIHHYLQVSETEFKQIFLSLRPPTHTPSYLIFHCVLFENKYFSLLTYTLYKLLTW